MKILHCVIDDKFIDGAISLFDKDGRVENLWVYVAKFHKKNFAYIKNNRVRIVPLEQYDQIIQDVDVVVLHSLPALPIEKIISTPKRIKIVWFAWGYDLYEGYDPIVSLPLLMPFTRKIWSKLTPSLPILKRIKRRIKKTLGYNYTKSALSRINYFSGVFPYEYDLLKNKYKQFKAHRLDFYYGSDSFFIKNDVSREINNNMHNIIIGNSADIANNHVDILSMVASKLNLSDHSKIIIPLSYGGSEEYVTIVENKAESLFHNNARIIKDYLPLDEYWKLVSNCRIAIYGHVRQQASDNIFYQLMNGAKVYMTKKSIAFEYLRGLGLYIFSLEDDIDTINDSLTIEEIIHNRLILTKEYSIDTLFERVKKINNILIEKCM